MTAKFAQGDRELVLKLMDDDDRFAFPGRSSFAADATGGAGIERWLRRFVAMHPRYEILDVIVSGPPSNTRLGVRMRDRIGGGPGTRSRRQGVAQNVPLSCPRIPDTSRGVIRWAVDPCPRNVRGMLNFGVTTRYLQ
jgi:hypothetical protein